MLALFVFGRVRESTQKNSHFLRKFVENTNSCDMILSEYEFSTI